jgi:hypothetical protein
MALSATLRNIKNVYDVGDLPFKMAEKIIRHIENPDQLYHIEQSCPQIAAEVDAMNTIWHQLISRKYPKWDEISYPITEDMHWIDIYHLVKQDQDRRTAEATARLKAQMAGIAQAGAERQTQVISLNQAPPLPGRRRRAALGATRNKGLQTIFQKARREAKETSMATAHVRDRGQLAVRAGQLRKAPQAMVHDKKVASNPEMKIRAPRRMTLGLATNPQLQRNEDRLLAIKKQAASATTADQPSSPGMSPMDFMLKRSSSAVSSSQDRRAESAGSPSTKLASRVTAAGKRPTPDTNWDGDSMEDLFDSQVAKKPKLDRDIASPSRPAQSSASPPKASTGSPAPFKRSSGLLSSSAYRQPSRVIRRTVPELSPSKSAAQPTSGAGPSRATAERDTFSMTTRPVDRMPRKNTGQSPDGSSTASWASSPSPPPPPRNPGRLHPRHSLSFTKETTREGEELLGNGPPPKRRRPSEERGQEQETPKRKVKERPNTMKQVQRQEEAKEEIQARTFASSRSPSPIRGSPIRPGQDPVKRMMRPPKKSVDHFLKLKKPVR